MAICGLSLHQGATESHLEQNSSSKSAHLIPTVLTNAFHLTNVFLFSRCHVTTNSVAPPPPYKLHTTNNSPIRSDEGLTLETPAFRIPVRWSIYIINSVDKTKFLYTTPPPTQHQSFFRNYSLSCILQLSFLIVLFQPFCNLGFRLSLINLSLLFFFVGK